jgi:hypothetical protein
MLSIEKPELYHEILGYPGGIHCVRISGESTPRIILKLPVSFLLPAKVNQGFKVYVIPVEVFGSATLGLMCAFFDDADCPLVSWRLLDDCDETLDLMYALAKRDAFVHLFDEQNRELLGYRAQIYVPPMARSRLEHMSFTEITHESSHAAHEQAIQWFGLRKEEDDADAIHIRFEEPLFAEDVIIDAHPDLYQFHGDNGCGHTSLERVEPGPYQEIDIVLLLQRVFEPEQIYHGPKRYYDKEEIADVIVITDAACLIVQAKDSPNTEKTLNRTLERKRLASVHMLDGALKQLKGSVSYIDRTRPLRMLVDGTEVIIDVGKRNVLSLAVVRELFVDMYDDYSRVLFDFFDDVGLPCIALEYSELHQYTTFCRDEASFLGAYFQVFDKARELGSYPRLRFGVRDAEELRRGQTRARPERE